MKVVISVRHRAPLWNWPPADIARLRREFPGVHFVEANDSAQLNAGLADADVYVGWLLTPEQFAAAPRLAWIHSPAAAVHQLLYPELIASPVLLTSAHAVHGAVVAGHALALMLALARGLHRARDYQLRSEWASTPLLELPGGIRELCGETALLAGLGEIGRALVPSLKGLGMRVLALRRRPELGPGGADAVFPPEQLADLLPDIQWLVLALPLTSSTRALIGPAELARMRCDAFLVNVGRGALVDEAALAATLTAGKLAGAGMDVFEHEPLPAASPLWKLPSVLITPHLAGAAPSLWERQRELFAENLRRFLARQPLLYLLDKQRGY